MKHPSVRTALAAAMLSSLSLPALADADVEARLKALEVRLNTLETENNALKSQLEATDRKAIAASEQIDKVAAAAPSGKTSWADRTQIGGYGELHYNNLDGEGGATDKDEIDFHRFVLFASHQFSDRVRFFSELEVEHTGVEADGNPLGGEVELEQAYLEFDLNDNHRAKAGLFLVPIGIINETHEPATFYGVERNPVESAIIPATWWAGGVALSGNLGNGFSYDVALHEGLETTPGSNFAVRSGRQKTSNAVAKDMAGTARLKWTGIPGIELGGSFQYQSDVTQSAVANAGSANLYELHGIANKGAFGLKALYARWDLDGSAPAAVGADEQYGWYVEPSFRINEQWGVFARYNEWNNRAGTNGNTQKQQTDVGLNYWPHPGVVLKADYQIQDNDDGRNQDGFNLGVGYQF